VHTDQTNRTWDKYGNEHTLENAYCTDLYLHDVVEQKYPFKLYKKFI
jgi:hypothetical protein